MSDLKLSLDDIVSRSRLAAVARMKRPTQRQLEVHAWMRSYQLAHGMPPTAREIKTAFGWRSTNAVADHLTALVNKGLVRHRPNVARAFLALDVAQEGAANAP